MLCPVLEVPLSSTFLTPRKCELYVLNTNSEFSSDVRILTYGQPRFAQVSNSPNCFDGQSKELVTPYMHNLCKILSELTKYSVVCQTLI